MAGVIGVILGSLKGELERCCTIFNTDTMASDLNKNGKEEYFDYVVPSPHPIFQSLILLKDRHFFVCFTAFISQVDS